MDYILASGGTDYTFQSDTTYYVTGNLFYYGTTTFEGGVVIKYSPVIPSYGSPRILLYQGGINCKTSAYRPAIFTARDDDSVGETLWGESTGTPSGYYAYECIATWDYGPAAYVHDVLFNYAYCGFGGEYRLQNEVRHAQILNSYEVVYALAATVNLRNVLCQNCYYGLIGNSSSTLTGENMSYDGGGQLIYNVAGSTFNLTNCLIAAVANTSGFSGSNNQVFSSSSGLFQTVGGGYHYLAADSPYRNAGTASINSGLLTDLKSRTTYPPLILSSVATDTILNPQAQRDTDAVDIGYHYSPLDYLLSNLSLTSASLTLTNGVAVGYYGNNGILLYGGSKLVSGGTADNLNHLARYRTVQENAFGTSETTPSSAIYGPDAYSPTPEIRFRFTDLCVSNARHIRPPFVGPMIITLRDCQVRGGTINLYGNGGVTVDVNNCLFERVRCYFKGSTVTVYNDTFVGGWAYFYANTGETYTIRDNLFDTGDVWNSTDGTLYLGNNAFLGYDNLTPNGPNDVLLNSSPAYQTGPLGSYYLLSGIALINAGSRTAAAAGLYHHTVTTDQAKEAGSTVDIGFHYVALNGSNLPVDTDGDGLADCLEDANGNGSVDSGETAWNNSSDQGLQVKITKPKTSSILP